MHNVALYRSLAWQVEIRRSNMTWSVNLEVRSFLVCWSWMAPDMQYSTPGKYVSMLTLALEPRRGATTNLSRLHISQDTLSKQSCR